MAQITTRDKDIISKSFRMLTRGIAPTEVLEILDWDRYFNVFSSATGDNRYINPIAQWSPATDPRYGRLMQTPEEGFGSMYKEIYEDNVTLLTITPGVAQFAGLLSFITNMFSPTAAIIANKGRAPGLSFYMGQAYGSIAFWPMQLFSISTQFLAFLMDSPRHNFWTVKPAMGAFTMAATGVLNDMLVKLGYTDPILPSRAQEQSDPLYGLKPNYDNTKAVSELNSILPGVVNSDGTIDLMRLVMKGTRKHRVMIKRLAEMDNMADLNSVDNKLTRARQIMEEVTFDNTVIAGSPTQNYIEKEMNTVGKYRGDDEGMSVEQDSAYLDQAAYNNINNGDTRLAGVSGVGSAAPTPAANPTQTMQGMGTSGVYGTGTPGINPNERQGRPIINPDGSNNPNVAGGAQIYYEDNPDNRTWGGDIVDLVATAISGGMDAITFRVEGVDGPVSDSFSNSHTKSALAEKFNSITKQVNDFRFNIGGGTIDGGLIDGIINTVKEAGIGALSGTVIGNIPLAVANNTYVKIPDNWSESTSSLHKESYTLNFHCNYAHPYEQIVKIWTPFSLLISMVAGFSAGGSSNTTPFYVKVFCKSRTVIRTGLCTQMDFEFGHGPGGWTKDRKPLNLRVRMTFTDLEDLVTIPIDRSISVLDLTNPAAVANRILSDDTAANNWFTRLAGVDYLDTILKYSRLNRQLTQAELGIKQSFRADNIAAKISDSVFGDFARIFTKPISR